MNEQRHGWWSRGQPVFGLLRTAWTEYEHDYASFLASAMVYHALVSLVPMLLLLLSGLGLLLRFSDAAAAAEQHVLQTVEQTFGPELPAMIRQLLDRLQQGSIIATLASLVGLVATASALFRQLRLAFRAIWKHKPPLMSGSVRLVMRSTLVEQAIAYVMVFTAALLLLLALALMAIFQWLSGWFSSMPRLDIVRAPLALPVPLLLVTITFALLFKFLPPIRLVWRHVWQAAVLCAVGWFVAAEALTLYGVFLGTSPGAYGALGGLLVIMLWMNVVSKLLFYGAELCKVVASQEDFADRGETLGDSATTHLR